MIESSAVESIVQIFISDDDGDPPEILHGPIASVQQSFSQYQYTCYNGQRLREFIQHILDQRLSRLMTN